MLAVRRNRDPSCPLKLICHLNMTYHIWNIELCSCLSIEPAPVHYNPGAEGKKSINTKLLTPSVTGAQKSNSDVLYSMSSCSTRPPPTSCRHMGNKHNQWLTFPNSGPHKSDGFAPRHDVCRNPGKESQRTVRVLTSINEKKACILEELRRSKQMAEEERHRILERIRKELSGNRSEWRS